MKKIIFTSLIILSTIFAKAQTWENIVTLTSENTTINGSQYGYSLSLNETGDVVAIGDYDSDYNGNDAGHTEVYHNYKNVWKPIGTKIIGEAPSDLSGYSVSLNDKGDRIAIGAPWNDGNPYGGNVTVFYNDGGNWKQLGNDIDGDTWDISGGNVCLSADGNTLALSANQCKDGDKKRVGYVKVFKYNGTDWELKGQIIRGENAYDQIGYAISLSKNGNNIAISSTSVNNYKGFVKVYNLYENNWFEILKKEGNYDENNFGYSVSLNSDGTILAVGSREKSDKSLEYGFASVYKKIGKSWTQIGNDIKSDGTVVSTGKNLELNDNGDVLVVTETSNTSIYKNVNDEWVKVYNKPVTSKDVAINGLGNIVAITSGSNSVEILKFNPDLAYNENSVENFNLFPNPTSGTITIETKGIEKVDIYNITGSLIKTVNTGGDNLKLDLSNQKKGMYFVKVKTHNTTIIKKLLLN